MSNARRAVPSFSFNGKNVTTTIAPYLESVSYEDIASGNSDSLYVSLHNVDFKWLDKWYPQKGDRVEGSITFKNWEKDGENLKLSCGVFVLDEIKFSGGPLSLSLGCLAIPADESFKTRERTKTWKNVTIRQIAENIASEYNLQLFYSGADIQIDSLEQSQKTDSAFLYELCEEYGLSMKVYNNKIVIYEQTAQEELKAVATLNRRSFIGDEWEYTDAFEGTYTGARISYKTAYDNKEISIYVGLKAEDSAGSRMLKVTETASSEADARRKAVAKVNRSNEKTTDLSGLIWVNPKICAGVCVNVIDMGKISGKYFVDKCVTEVSSWGAKQTVSMHKCQQRLK